MNNDVNPYAVPFAHEHAPLSRVATAWQQDNLRTLRDFLFNLTPPDDPSMGMSFDMNSYCVNRQHITEGSVCADVSLEELFDSQGRKRYECGSVACAIGHGPRSGIQARRDEGWSEYEHRVFGSAGYSRFNLPNAMHVFLFGTVWARPFRDTIVDNTARGAARRINYALAFGIPHGRPELGWLHCPIQPIMSEILARRT